MVEVRTSKKKHRLGSGGVARAAGTTRVLFGLLCWSCFSAAAAAGVAGPPRAAVASAHPAATAAGREIIDHGGNAFDAAVAVAAALAVVEPFASGLGGGGFFLLSRAPDGKEIMIDAREKAPLAATADMYLDENGELAPERSLNGPLAAAIPGLPAGLAQLSRDYGRLSLASALAPAIRLARSGFRVTDRYRDLADFRAKAFSGAAHGGDIFLIDGAAPAMGQTIVQIDLAETLERLAKDGAAGFYDGVVAQALVEGVRGAGGIWTREDLTGYRVVEREPITATYRGIRMVSASPPSSGGIVLAEILNILEQYDLSMFDPDLRRHVMIEAMRRAYRDRASYLGDPDYVQIPIDTLISKRYAQQKTRNLSLDRATLSANLPAIGDKPEGGNTTHFSILDREGNRVAATLSINYPFGAAFVPPGTGVLLNNEMDDFSARPLTPNVYGLIGGEANAIGPGRRPLSSMTPTFLETDDKIGILGTPGGSRIISMVLIGALAFADGKGPVEWVGAKRFHHQYLPDEVQFERGGLNSTEQADLRRRGHRLREISSNYGNMQAILWNKTTGVVAAASDPRGEGSAVVWESVSRGGSQTLNVGSADNKNSSVVQ